MANHFSLENGMLKTPGGFITKILKSDYNKKKANYLVRSVSVPNYMFESLICCILIAHNMTNAKLFYCIQNQSKKHLV